MKIIDAHIHLDQYKDEEISSMMNNSDLIETLISVSFDLHSCIRNLHLARTYQKVKPAFGYHPEQSLLNEEKQNELFHWIDQNSSTMIAVGEVGLPYYLRMDQKVSKRAYGKYIELLEKFIKASKKWDKPIVLHAVYDDAPIVCDLLENQSVTKAHFHWFKGDKKTILRMMNKNYFVSITPDVCYEEEIQQLVQTYPLELMMVETDGPWPFDGPFLGQMTHPNMLMKSIEMIARLKNIKQEKVMEKLRDNTINFYRLNEH